MVTLLSDDGIPLVSLFSMSDKELEMMAACACCTGGGGSSRELRGEWKGSKDWIVEVRFVWGGG